LMFAANEFQTNSREVEAPVQRGLYLTRRRFRRTLVRLKPCRVTDVGLDVVVSDELS